MIYLKILNILIILGIYSAIIYFRIKDKDEKISICNIIKVLFCIGLLIYDSITYSNLNYMYIGIIDLFFIYSFTMLISTKFKRIGQLINDIGVFLFAINILVHIFGGSYTNRIMLSNLGSIDELVGNAFIYITAVVLCITATMLPYKKTATTFKQTFIVFIIAIILGITAIISINPSKGIFRYSSIGNYYYLIRDEIKYQKILKLRGKTELSRYTYYKDSINDYRKKDKALPKKPNIIMFFIEGLSNEPIYDSRNFMPNIKEFSQKSISFKNYYNHEFATYRGIIGQFFSGFQIENEDPNYLLNVGDVLRQNGYISNFINIDPKCKLFNDQLEYFNFDKIYSDLGKMDGMAQSYSDRTGYEKMLEIAKELNKSNKPFMLSEYTLGTHVSLDSIYQKFNDGKSNVLNRFYENDFYFGKFLEEFNKSELADNTIIVLTTDHASYMDMDYKRAFKNSKRKSVSFDTIPLMIYYKGITPEEIDVNGRTSLNVMPTILDFLDINGDNYFLGESLFSPLDKATEYDYIYNDGGWFHKSYNNFITDFVGVEDEFLKTNIFNYSSVAIKKEK